MSRRRVLCVAVVAAAVAAPFLPPAASVVADDEPGPSVPGEFIVELKSEADADIINQQIGGIAAPERLSPSSAVWLFRLDRSADPVDAVRRIENTTNVVDAQANILAELPEFSGGRVRFWTDLEPPDPTTPSSLATIDQPALGSAGLPADGATGVGVTVAVLDTGLDGEHPVFADRIAPGGFDFVDNDPTPSEEENDVDDNGNGAVDEAFGHGTYVAGLVRLVAVDARILPIRILDTDGVTTAWRILQGLELGVREGAAVINLSLGGKYLGDIVGRNVEQLEKLGIAVVAAAGNSASNELRYPAAFNGVVAATAIDGTTGNVATFSNTGSWIDVAAPGVRVISAYPNGRYATWGGTSAAAPVVSGAVALLREIMPTGDVDDVIDNLTSTAHPDGLPDVSAYGRIDVHAAIIRATTR